MKKATAFRVVAYCALVLGGFGPPAMAQTFSRRYDPLGQHALQTGWSIEVMSDGRIISIGNGAWTDSINYGSVIHTIELSATGAVISEHRVQYPWHSTYPGWANSADRCVDGGFVVGGGSVDSTGTNRAMFFLFDSSGTPQQFFEYNLPGQSWIGRQAKQTPDGGFALVGTMNDGVSPSAFVLKTNGLGALQWSTTFPAPDAFSYGISVDTRPGNGLYVGGATWDPPNDYQTRLLCLDSMYQVLWSWESNTLDDDASAHITTAANGDALVATAYGNGVVDTYWPVLMRFDAGGSLLWNKQYGEAGYVTALYAIKEVQPNSDLIASGTSTVPGDYHGMLLRTASNGDSLWLRLYLYADSLMNDGEGGFRDVEPTPDGGFVAVGTVFYSASGNDPPQYNQDVWVVKVDSMGCLVPGCDGIGMIGTQVTNYRDALSVAPNPASDIAQLSWQLPARLAKGIAQLSVVGAAGNVVRTEQIDLSRGTHELDVSALAPGIYYLHVVSAGIWVTGAKLVVVS